MKKNQTFTQITYERIQEFLKRHPDIIEQKDDDTFDYFSDGIMHAIFTYIPEEHAVLVPYDWYLITDTYKDGTSRTMDEFGKWHRIKTMETFTKQLANSLYELETVYATIFKRAGIFDKIKTL